MASTERRRANYAANRFAKDLESDWMPNSSMDDHNHAKSDMKWWLHTKSKIGGKENYTCQHLNSWESELSAVYAEYTGDNVKVMGDFDALSSIGSANVPVEQSWNIPTMRSNNTKLPKTEASRKSDSHLTLKKKDQEELCFPDGDFMECDIADFSISDQGKLASSDLESHLVGAEKTEHWWHASGKDELAGLVSQKSLENIENCDLPKPLSNHIRERSIHDKTPSLSLNQKAKIVDSCTSRAVTSAHSFQDSNIHFSSPESKESCCSSKEGSQTSSEKGNMSELMEALCHSQTRAREAENAAKQAYCEKEHILSLFFRQASLLFAYKQWFQMLQLENLCLQLRSKNQPLLKLIPEMHVKKSHGRGSRSKRKRKCGIGKSLVAFAVGLGLAGAGLLLGWTMGWMFPTL